MVEYSTPIRILSYNIYFKSMLGIDQNFSPQHLAQTNVKNVLKNNYDIIGLQEVECFDKIYENNGQVIKGKSGKETMVTILSDKFKIIKSEIKEFCEGRGIQLVLIEYKDNIWLIVNIHAPHYYNNFGDYYGENNVSMLKYNNEITKILNETLERFIGNYKIDRLIILGDFNEAFEKSNFFSLEINNKSIIMKTSNKKPLSCCYRSKLSGIEKTGDLIYDSKIETINKIAKVEFPASDHLPVETTL